MLVKTLPSAVVGLRRSQLCSEAYLPTQNGSDNYLRLRDRILRGE